MAYSCSESLRSAAVEPGELAVYWLGQAGFAFKTSGGKILYVDPYLTDSVESLVGFKRLCPSVVAPEEVEADALLISHHHEDHLDRGALPTIAARTGARFVAPPQSAALLGELGIGKERIAVALPGSEIDLGFCLVHPVFADHGEMAPDALGFVLDFGVAKVYFTGDTAYRPDKMAAALAFGPDIVIPVINGAYGNMDSKYAARLVRDAQAAVAIPCHFWTFMEHGGDPALFARECAGLSPSTKLVWLTPGTSYIHRG
jgi:L-ascorbate 6-phosphate lactonase